MKARQSYAEFRHALSADWRNNGGHWRSRLVLLHFRLAHFTREGPMPFRLFRLPMAVVYRVVSEVLCSMEIPIQTDLGPGVRVRHGFGLVVHKNTRVGSGTILRQGVTIGVRRTGEQQAPQIGENVDIGANSIIIGGITIGSNAVIAAGSIVLGDVPEGAIMVGAPARVIRFAISRGGAPTEDDTA